MKYRRLGRTDLQCAEIGLGTWALGSRVYGNVEYSAAERLVRRALDQGINFFDTAPLYGRDGEDGVAESVLGKALGADREKVIISTKFGRTASQVMPGRFCAAEARASCEASLRRLGRDWIDVFFFHSPFSPDEIDDDVWEALRRLREEGKIRFIGHSVSKFPETGELSAGWLRDRAVDVVQVVLSPFNREARPLIATAKEEDCGVIARECLANGFLSGTIRKDTAFPEESLNARYTRAEIEERVDYAEELHAALVDGNVSTLPQAAYRWVLDQPGISLALSGAKNPGELEDPLKAAEAAPYPGSVLAAVERMHAHDFGAA